MGIDLLRGESPHVLKGDVNPLHGGYIKSCLCKVAGKGIMIFLEK